MRDCSLTWILCEMAQERVPDQEFLEAVVKALVDHPDEVKTERKVDEMGVLLTLYINPADMGQIIGRNGRTARAIRTLLRVVGAKNNARVNLKIHEPEGSRPAGGRGFAASPDSAPASQEADDSGVEDLKL